MSAQEHSEQSNSLREQLEALLRAAAHHAGRDRMAVAENNDEAIAAAAWAIGYATAILDRDSRS